MRTLLPLLAALSSGCAFTNPLGFWDIVELSVAVDGADTTSQVDYGTMEVFEEGNVEHAVIFVRYFPVIDPDSGEALFAPQETPLQSKASWDDLAEEEGFSSRYAFNFYSGVLTIDRYRGPKMTLVGEGQWGSKFGGAPDLAPVEVTVELER